MRYIGPHAPDGRDSLEILASQVHKASADYAARIANGQLTFDPNGFAHYPYNTDPWLSGWLGAHLPEMER